jgi:hypothetical protein
MFYFRFIYDYFKIAKINPLQNAEISRLRLHCETLNDKNRGIQPRGILYVAADSVCKSLFDIRLVFNSRQSTDT